MTDLSPDTIQWLRVAPGILGLFVLVVPGAYHLYHATRRFKSQDEGRSVLTDHEEDEEEREPLLPSLKTVPPAWQVRSVWLWISTFLSALLLASNVYGLASDYRKADPFVVMQRECMVLSWTIFLFVSISFLFSFGKFVYSDCKSQKLVGWKRLFITLAALDTLATVYFDDIKVSVWWQSPLLPVFAASLLFVSEYHVVRLITQQTAGQRMASPEKQASLLSRLTFSWFDPLVAVGQKKVLEEHDLWETLTQDQSEAVISRFRQFRDSPGPLWWKLLLVIRKLLAWQFFFSLCSALLAFTGPFFLNRIVFYIESPDKPRSMAWVFLVGMFVCTLIKSASDGQLYFEGRRNGIHVRNILINEIYRKSLRRIQMAAVPTEEGEEGDTSNAKVGKIVTLMSVDTERVREYVSYCHIVLWTPLQIIIAVASLVYVLGWPALTGVFFMAATVPATMVLGKWTAKVQEILMESTDQRVNVMNEVLNCVRIIKYFAWEPQFMKKILDARDQELRNLIRYYMTEAVSSLLWHSSPLIVGFSTFFTYTVVAGHTLDATTVFTGLSLMNALSQPLVSFPHELLDLFKAVVSVGRIEKFLAEDELERYSVPKGESDDQSRPISRSPSPSRPQLCGFRQASFTYFSKQSSSENVGKESEPLLQATRSSASLLAGNQFTLRDLNIEFTPKALTVICGSTGSGKSSLILALLGEMHRVAGNGFLPRERSYLNLHESAALDGGVAYVAQSAWLMNATVRDNILFGEPYDPVRYQQVIQACALSRDLDTWPAGDLTEIGEKGINCSGGQRQRISLARAAYSCATFVLLDDPLSAVDAPTARHLFEKCISGLMANRTRILVTHAVGLVLPHATHVVVMRSGELLAQGSVDDVIKSEAAEAVLGADAIKSLNEVARMDSEVSLCDKTEETEIKENNAENTEKGKLVSEETKQSGSVSLDVYLSYVKATGGVWFVAAFATGLVATYGLKVLNDWWLKEWADSTSEIAKGTHHVSALWTESVSHVYQSYKAALLPYFHTEQVDKPRDNQHYLLVYALLGLAMIVADNVSFLVTATGAYRASKRLHSLLLNRILNAPMRFFDTTPIGRIMNRFSKDIGSIDSDVMPMMGAFVQVVVQGIVVLVVISVITPSFLLVAVPVACLYYRVAGQYLAVSRELKRLDSVSKSPIYSLFSETLAGVSTIRAYNAETRFMRICADRVDKNNRAFFWMWLSNRWLSMRIDFIAALVVFFAGSALLMGTISAGLAGLSLTYALQFTMSLLWTVRLHALMEMNMNSVERVNEYLEIDQEPPAVVPSNRPPAAWPTEGAIDVRQLFIRYAPDAPDVLKGISFSCAARTKVGIVGRTGAGKSSLSLAFFRILDIHSGQIVIDGIDIATIGLQDLRSKLTIIPQDPVLFSGTLRTNLDPFGEHDDLTLWQALRQVHFVESLQGASSSVTTAANSRAQSPVTDSLPCEVPAMESPSSESSSASLDMPVSENGGNFSQGQRQLLCLARALLRNSKVVILDEATASVDNETDLRIQKTIRECFQQSTVLTIAHRLRTVMDYDKILVLDQGSVKEYDTPLALITNETSQFRKMCEETGEFGELMGIAEKN